MSGIGMLLDGLRSMLSPPFFLGGGGSGISSVVGSNPLVRVWGLCLVLTLSRFFEPATFIFVAQHLSHCVPVQWIGG